MGVKVARALEWFEKKAKIPALEKARINLYMKRDVTSDPMSVPDDPETLRQLKEAIKKVLKTQDTSELDRMIYS